VSGRGRDRDREKVMVMLCNLVCLLIKSLIYRKKKERKNGEKEKETMHRECLGGERNIKKHQGRNKPKLKN
jgi:hypothetical protein